MIIICEQCGEKHDDDLICKKCKRCLISENQSFHEKFGIIRIQCTECNTVCIVDELTFSDNGSPPMITPEQDPIKLEDTFDISWGTDSEGELPMDPPDRQMGHEERKKIFFKELEERAILNKHEKNIY